MRIEGPSRRWKRLPRYAADAATRDKGVEDRAEGRGALAIGSDQPPLVLDASWGLRPYLGAGLGFPQHDVTEDAFTLTVNGDTHEFASSSSDDTVFAYQVMLGLSYPLSDSAEARFGYRYFATSEADFDRIKVDYGSHNLEFGILFRF